jgi:hypothetical protein
MHLEYKLTYSDFKAAVRLHESEKLRKNALRDYLISEFASVFMPLLAIAVGVAVVPLLISHFNTRKLFKGIFSRYRLNRSYSINMDDKQIIISYSAASDEKYSWADFCDFAHDEKISLIYLDKDRILTIPTHTLSSNQRTALNDLVARNVVRKAK